MFRFWIFAIMLLMASALTSSAEHQGLPVTEMQEILSLVDKSDIDGLMRAIDGLDEKYGTTHQAEYIKNMSILCKQLAAKAHANNSLMIVLHKCASSFLLKDTINDLSAGPLCLNQRDAIVALLSATIPPASENQEWTTQRSHTCRLAMLFARRVKILWNPNYKMEKVFVNVPFPSDLLDDGVPRGFATGGDPAEITNPVTRAKYENAIKQNSEKSQKNSEQRTLAEIVKFFFPRLESEIIRLYSEKPVSYEEVAEYLELGGFSTAERSRIISSIAQKFEKQPSAGLLNDK